jgi:hypothetical protein
MTGALIRGDPRNPRARVLDPRESRVEPAKIRNARPVKEGVESAKSASREKVVESAKSAMRVP